MIYLIGSLRNQRVPVVAEYLRRHGFSVFDDWYAAGPEADDCWQRYEQGRGFTMDWALRGPAARNVFEFDRRHLIASSAVVLLAPAGKSAHLELGWCLGGCGGACPPKPGYVLFDKEPERWDVMYQFADGVFFNPDDLVRRLKDLSIE